MIMDKIQIFGRLLLVLGAILAVVSTQGMIGFNYQLLVIGMIVVGFILMSYRQIFKKTIG